jgi:hypothetical protein
MFTTLGSEAGFFSVEQGLLYLEVWLDSSRKNRVYYTWKWSWILLSGTGFTILGSGARFFSVEEGLHECLSPDPVGCPIHNTHMASRVSLEVGLYSSP